MRIRFLLTHAHLICKGSDTPCLPLDPSFTANAVKICEDVIRRLLVLYKYSVALQAELSNQGQTQLYKKSPFPSNVDPPAGDPAVERSREVGKVVCHASESHQAGSAPRTAPAEQALPLVAL